MLRSRLTWKLFACYVGTVGLSIIGLATAAAVESDHRAVATVEHHLEIEVRFLHNFALRALSQPTNPSWRPEFDLLSKEDPLRITLFRADGSILVDSTDDDPEKRMPLSLMPDVRNASESTVTFCMRFDQEGHRIGCSALPVNQDGKLLGYAQAALPLANFDAQSLMFNSALFSFSVLIGTVALIPGLFIMYRVVKPIGMITRWARVLTAGGTADLPTCPPGEIRALAHALADMHMTLLQSMSELKISENRKQIIFASSHDAIFTTDLSGRIIDFNPAAETIFGLAASAAVGHNAEDLVVPERLRNTPDSPWRLRAAGSPEGAYNCRVETTARRADGSEFPIELAIVSAGTDALNVCTVFVRDITKRHRAEKELREINEQLEQRVATRTRELEFARIAADSANEAKSRFLAAVSHDLRTPMTAILGYTDLLMTSRLSADEQDRCVQTIHRTGQHLVSLLNDLLDFAKIESGKMTIERAVASPTTIIHDVVSLMRVKAAEKGLTIHLDLTQPVPQTIQTDVTRLRQILMNLVGNAVKFTDKGSVSVRASLQPASAEASTPPQLVIEVSDTGIGIPPDYFGKLFIPFVQGPLHNRGGTGLGLALCKAFAELLGGSITACNNVSRGSTFTLKVETGPLDGVPVIAPGNNWQPEPDCAPHAEVYPRLRGRVLIAEDGLDIQWLIEYLFQNMGVEVTIVDNGQAAVDVLRSPSHRQHPYDLVMLDMQMPILNGYEAAELIRRDGYNGPVIAMTASVDSASCMRAGCTAFISKPIDKQQFIQMVAGILPPADASAPAPKPKAAIQSDPDFQRFLPRYLAVLASQIGAINRHFQQNDITALAKVLHQIRGSAAMYGFEILGLAATRAEEMLKGSSPDAAKLYAAVEQITALARRIQGYDIAHEIPVNENPLAQTVPAAEYKNTIP